MRETIGRNTDEMIDDVLVDRVSRAYTKVFNWAYCSTWDMLDTIPNDYRIGILCHTTDDLTVAEVEVMVNRIADDLGLDAPVDVIVDDYMDDQISWIQPINYVSHLESQWSRFIFHDDKPTEVIPIKPPQNYKGRAARNE